MDFKQFLHLELGASQRILITPLNWGLGHASRCIPIIQYLLANQKDIYLATDGVSLSFLKNEFPDIECILMPSYGVRYPFRNMKMNMLINILPMLLAIIRERRTVASVVRKYYIDTIISDNRYGARFKNTRNIFIGHQLSIPVMPKWLGRFLSYLQSFWIHKFDECWVPDFPPPHNISGRMIQFSKTTNIKYMGILSRFQKLEREKVRELLVILSGPEPARTKLEKEMGKTLRGRDYLLVRGVPGKINHVGRNNRVDMMTSEMLNEAICSSEWIICRAGYSGIMDMIITESKAIIIPTPGQPEQEYLSQRMSVIRPKQFYSVREDRLEDISTILDKGQVS
ncbi:MAG TPA: hypothetical protein PKC30_12020 [Saprospiraceae bacterium]|nr:hypothetical protein [Saprospiraceae bacterium]